eukprot:CAMPEP_0170611380 /NCGR_PEP_ID=MMETSP0224-20130122/23160_1 /TAXON_ID=285029 /ORGANISM="Togula jolla, Strain CCCM 725" /LENGTH=768 /DNA_ID=CAMNT_0010936815 /DNA_START=1 /DNA_END=2308 /DNA_ORIENTATION=-
MALICAGLFLIALTAVADSTGAASRGVVGRQREALLQSWEKALDGTTTADKASDTPVTRVVKLLKQMQSTLQKEMDEDAAMYDKLACWCNNNKHEKTSAISEAEAKMSDLSSTAEGLTAKVVELKVTIKQLQEDASAGKEGLATALALREKEKEGEFTSDEKESMQAIANLKAAIVVLSKHYGAALPQMSLSLLSLRGKGRAGRSGPWDHSHESRLARSFDDFLEKNGFLTASPDGSAPSEPHSARLVQEATSSSGAGNSTNSAWTSQETEIVRRAIGSASAFMQARRGEDYYPSYSARSGQLMGLLRELKEQMEGDLSEAQKIEMERASAFAQLRDSKEAEIAAAEKQAESKEDELAKSSMDLAEAKEDFEMTEASLSEYQKFVVTLKETCDDADKNFEQRKSMRLAEIKAVSEAVAILTSDESRDTLSRTYSLVQMSSRRSSTNVQRNVVDKASAFLKRAAGKIGSPQLSVLASRVELDSFSRVKKAIDDMVLMLKKQQEDEVKKHDWCNAELHSNEVASTKTEDLKSELSAEADEAEQLMRTFTEEVQQAKVQVSQLQLDLQAASVDRLKGNLDFQKTVADQRSVQWILKSALERLGKYYEQQELLQTNTRSANATDAETADEATPPVSQVEYKPSSGASGVMSLLEKLIQEAKGLEAESTHGEMAAQAQYEALVADTNASIQALQREIAMKVSAKADKSKEKSEAQADLSDAVSDLEGLGKYNAELHGECDYLLGNFAARQEARSQEMEALQQAKQILSGASLS